MPHRRRASQLALKLDVIVEEDASSIVDHVASQPVQSATTFTITLQNSKRSSGNDPQFLHLGKWPCMQMVEQYVQSVNKSIDKNVRKGSISKTWGKQSQSIGTFYSHDDDITHWLPVTVDQLSMAMDLWNPDEYGYPTLATMSNSMSVLDTAQTEKYVSATAVQRCLFHREIMDEYRTRIQTLGHLEELEDNDNAIEIVATLEGYRQNGWAEEMLKAFPRECWLFWYDSGLGRTVQEGGSYLCHEHEFSI